MEISKMWLIQLVLIYWCFNVCSSLECHRFYKDVAHCGTCYRKFDNSFLFITDVGCVAGDISNGRDARRYYCKTDMCNSKVEDKRVALKCLKMDGSTELCSIKMCFIRMKYGATIDAGCAMESDNGYSASDGSIGRTSLISYCYGDECNVHDKDQRHCHVGAYGDCEWTSSEGLALKPCVQHDSWNICIHQIWTPKDDPTRVCHKYLCHHDYVNHGEELIYKKFPNVTNSSMTDEIENANVQVEQCMVTNRSKSCFEVEKPPKIHCYKSDSKNLGDPVDCPDFVTHCRWTENYNEEVKSRGCSPTNVAPGKERCLEIGGVYTCDAPGDASNGREEAIKECYTGVEGNCTYFFKREINGLLYHAPIKTQCKEWSRRCYKSEFRGDGAKYALYGCDVFKKKPRDILNFKGRDTIDHTFVRKDSNITWNVTTARCEGEGCNAKLICEGDNCLKNNSGNKLVLMAVYFMVAVQGLLILG